MMTVYRTMKYRFLDNKSLSLESKGLMMILIERIGERDEDCKLYDAVNKIHSMPEGYFDTLIDELSQKGYISIEIFKGRKIYNIFC